MLISILTLLSHLFSLILGVDTPQSFPPPLSAEEERQCFCRMQKGDDEARQTLILHNLRLVSHIVRKYYNTGKNQEDLVSIGSIGLIKAVDSFDMSNGARFATYAAKCIQNEILMYFRSQKKLSCEISINETIDVDRDGNALTYMDVIGCEENMTENVERQLQIRRMMHMLGTVLSERERQVIVMRYGLFAGKPMTQRETAIKLGISRSYISRIEKGALEKLKEVLG